MPDRTDPGRTLRPQGQQADGAVNAADDPLAELAKIVTGRRSNFVSAARSPAPEGQAPARAAPSVSSSLGDLEAELINDLQASFASIRDSDDAVAEPAAPPRPVSRATPVAPKAETAARRPVDEPEAVEEPELREAAARVLPQPDEAVDPLDHIASEFHAGGWTAEEEEVPSAKEAFVPPPAERPRPAAPRYQPQPARSEELIESLQLRPTTGEVEESVQGETSVEPQAESSSRWDDPQDVRTAAASVSRFAPHRNGVSAELTDDDEDLFRDGGIFADRGEHDANEAPAGPAGLAPAFARDDTRADFADEDYQDGKPTRRRGSRTPFLVAGVIGVVLIGGIAVAMFRPEGDAGGPPPVIAANTDPSRITPEDMGGEDQSKQSYDRINSSDTSTDTTLLTPGTDVADVNSGVDDNPISRVIIPGGPGYDQPSGSGEVAGSAQDGIGALAANDAVEAPVELGPRRVRTVVVKPDGTIVESTAAEAGAEGAAPLPPLSSAPEALPDAPPRPVTDDTAAIAGTDPNGELPITPNASIDDLASAPSQPPATGQPTALAPAEPAPVERAQPQETVAGGVLVQVSSQRSEEAALATYRDLQSRYPSILGQYQANLQRADIAGRGTFYRVRVGPFSAGDAQRLCSDLKAAGGDCIIAQR